jgi:predicted patatin/cPLA2 family phospholipase
MSRDVILIIEGGTIQGVFSAGALSVFEKNNLYPRIDSVYAVSAGAHNAAYFLSHKTKEMKEIYNDYLGRKHKFMRQLSPKIVLGKIMRLMIWNETFDVMDLEYIENIEREVLKIDEEHIKKSPIKFFVKVFDRETYKIKYLDAKKNTVQRLMESANLPPYVNTRLKDYRYLDGGIMPNRSFIKEVIKKNPDKKIVYMFNNKKTIKRVLRHLYIDIGDALLKTRHFGFKYGRKHFRNILNHPYIWTVNRYKNVYVIYDSTGNSKRKINKDKISAAFQDGVRKGKLILHELNHPIKK